MRGKKGVMDAAGDIAYAGAKGGASAYAGAAAGSFAAAATSATIAATGIGAGLAAGGVMATAVALAPAVAGLGVACAAGSLVCDFIDDISRFLFRFAKEAKVTASESMLTIQKSFGFIFYVVLNMSKSAPVNIDIRDIKSVTVKESYSVWAGFFFILALACIRREAYLAMVILALIGYSELKYTKLIINYSGDTLEIGDSNSKTAPSIQGILNYIRKYNPHCIQEG